VDYFSDLHEKTSEHNKKEHKCELLLLLIIIIITTNNNNYNHGEFRRLTIISVFRHQKNFKVDCNTLI
jgi:hypothetical protein